MCDDEFGIRRLAQTQSIVVIVIPCPGQWSSCDVHSRKNGLMTSAPSPLADERKKLDRGWHFISIIAADGFGETTEVFGSMSKSFKLTQHSSKPENGVIRAESISSCTHSAKSLQKLLGEERNSRRPLVFCCLWTRAIAFRFFKMACRNAVVVVFFRKKTCYLHLAKLVYGLVLSNFAIIY